MKRYLTILMLAMTLAVSAETPDLVTRLKENKNVTVNQPQKLADKLMPHKAVVTTEEGETVVVSTGGYRIQAYSGNNPRLSKSEAQGRADAIAAEFPQWATYVSFAAPYWRVKVGDFRSYEEAQAAMSMIKKQFPDFARELRLVRDKIKAE